jgi:hypothetical protein
MKQTLDDGQVVYFGQDLTEAEKLFSAPAVDVLSRIARPGIDRMIKLENVCLRFDTGKLSRIEFNNAYAYNNPLTPYPERWKNFEVIGDKKIKKGMTRAEFLIYFEAWEKWSSLLGTENAKTGDLTGCQYSVSKDRDDYWDAFHMSMGPTRRAGGGGIWCDGWHVSFVVAGELSSRGKPQAGLLKSISAFRDEFNTVGRRKPSA